MTDPTSPSQEIVLETHDLTVAYDKKPVLYGIDVSIAPGQLAAVATHVARRLPMIWGPHL